MGYQIQEHCPDPIYRIIKIYLNFIYILKSYAYLAVISDDFYIVPGLWLLVEANTLSITILDTPPMHQASCGQVQRYFRILPSSSFIKRL